MLHPNIRVLELSFEDRRVQSGGREAKTERSVLPHRDVSAVGTNSSTSCAQAQISSRTLITGATTTLLILGMLWFEGLRATTIREP